MKGNLRADELELVTRARRYSDDDHARALLEKLRWPNGPVCPHCQNDGQTKSIYALKPLAASKAPARKGVFKCGACRRQFTVTVRTVFEASHLPIATWVKGLFILCASEKPVNAHQLRRMLDVTYKTARGMTQRIGLAMAAD